MEKEIEMELAAIKAAIEAENVSYMELAFLQQHEKEVLETGDIVLAEFAGIDEEVYHKAMEKKGN